MLYRLLSKIIAEFHSRKTQRYMSKLKSRGLELGTDVSILEPFFLDPDHCYLISIGANTTLAPNVRLIAHDASTSLHLGVTRFGRIKIGAGCFLGDSVIVLPNVEIGDGSIIGAGAVVTKDVPERSVAVGAPARVVMQVDDLLEETKRQLGGRKIFDESYQMGRVTQSQVAEMLADIDRSNGIGFMK